MTTLDVQVGHNLGPVAFSPDGELVGWGVDKEIKVTAVYRNEAPRTFAARSVVRALAFSPDGAFLVSGEDGAARVHAVADGHAVSDLDLVMPGLSAGTVAISCSGTLAVGTEFGDVIVRKLGDPSSLRRWPAAFLDPLPGVTPPPLFGDKWRGLTSVAFSRAGDLLATGGKDHEVQIWSMPSGERIRQFTDFHDFVNSVAFSPKGEEIAVACQERRIKLLGLAANRGSWDVAAPGAVRAVAYAPSGTWFAASVDGKDENFVTLNLARAPSPDGFSWHFLDECLHHRSPVTALSVSPRGDRIVTASQDQTVRLWRIAWLARALVAFSVNNVDALKSFLSKSQGVFLLYTKVGDDARTFRLSVDDILGQLDRGNGNGLLFPLPWRAASRTRDVPVHAQILLAAKNDDWNSIKHTQLSEGVAHVGSDEVTLHPEYKDSADATEPFKPILSASVRLWLFQGEDRPH